MAKLGIGEETDTACTYKNKGQKIQRPFSHFSETATRNDLAFLKKKQQTKTQINTMFKSTWSVSSFTEFLPLPFKMEFEVNEKAKDISSDVCSSVFRYTDKCTLTNLSGKN